MCLPGAAGVAAAGLSCSTRRDRVGPHVQYVTDKDLAMAHFKKAFPSKFLQVSDLDPDIHATITSVGAENVGGENSDLKLVVRFEEPGVKALVCNLTRAEAIAEIAGSEDTDHWPGTRIRLVRGMTRYQGKKVGCIVVQAPSKAKKAPTNLGDAFESPADDVMGF